MKREYAGRKLISGIAKGVFTRGPNVILLVHFVFLSNATAAEEAFLAARKTARQGGLYFGVVEASFELARLWHSQGKLRREASDAGKARRAVPLVTVPLYVAATGTGRLQPSRAIWTEPLIAAFNQMLYYFFVALEKYGGEDGLQILGRLHLAGFDVVKRDWKDFYATQLLTSNRSAIDPFEMNCLTPFRR